MALIGQIFPQMPNPGMYGQLLQGLLNVMDNPVAASSSSAPQDAPAYIVTLKIAKL